MDLGGFEPPFPQCECGVLPLDHRPASFSANELKLKSRNSKIKINLSGWAELHRRFLGPEPSVIATRPHPVTEIFNS